MYLILWKLFQKLSIQSLVLWKYLYQTLEILQRRLLNWIFYWSPFLQTSGLPKKVERKVKVSYLTILNIFPNFTLTLLFSAGRWQTVLIDQPYRFCYHSDKGEDCIRMICTACRGHKPEKKFTYAIARLVGHDPVSGQSFWTRCSLTGAFKSIKENPLRSITKVYEYNLESMIQEFFSQSPAYAETTK